MEMSNTDRKERRRYPRVKAPVELKPSSLFGKEGKILDISLGGMRVYSAERFEMGSPLEIDITLPGKKKVMSMVKPVWSRKVPGVFSPIYEIGLEFISLPFDALGELRSILEKGA